MTEKGAELMTLEDLKQNPITAAAALAATMQHNEKVFNYVMLCFNRLFSGDYGTMPQEDIDANNAELAAGAGRIVARYAALPEMEDDIYIISVFNKNYPGDNNNNTCALYCMDY